MPNNFHDVRGMLLLGLDRHSALLMPGVPVPMVPTPVPAMFKLNFLHPFSMWGGKERGTVFFNGVKAVAHWHQPKLLWPHLGLPPFPFDVLTPLQIAFGQQTCWLPRGSVILEGVPAAPASIYGPMGLNLDCWETGNIPSSLVLQPGTVQTTPSLADYRAGLVAVAIDFAIQVAVKLVMKAAFAGIKAAGRGVRNAIRSRSGNAIGDGMASRAAPGSSQGRFRGFVNKLFGGEAGEAAEAAAKPDVPSLAVPHQVQEGSTCGLNCLNMQMRFVDPEAPVYSSSELVDLATKHGIADAENGVHFSDLAKLGDALGYQVAHGENNSIGTLKAVVDEGFPVMTAVRVDDYGMPTTDAAGELHAMLIKGHFEDSGTDFLVASHPWPDAETLVFTHDEFAAAQAAADYAEVLIVTGPKP